MYTDIQIKNKGEQLIKPFDEAKVQAIGYDLTTDVFYRLDEQEVPQIELQPMESVFVQCKEEISLPHDCAANVVLRNSRIRQGLLLTAPVYYPGHQTPVFFRLTNVSAACITLKSGSELATIMFEQLSENVEKPYEGTFQKEKKYSGMGSYKHVYEVAMEKASKKIDELKATEKNIYTNVLAILAIFVAIFSVLNVNISIAQNFVGLGSLVVWNLCTLGAVGFLVSLVRSPKASIPGVIASILMLLIALLIAFVFA